MDYKKYNFQILREDYSNNTLIERKLLMELQKQLLKINEMLHLQAQAF